MSRPINIAVFFSGKGSNFESILNAIRDNRLKAKVTLAISNNPEAGGLEVARANDIPGVVMERGHYSSGEEFGSAMLARLQENQVDIIALAGYLRKIPPQVTRAYPQRIVNIHPALLPKFGGKGMYGHFVHEAVIQAGEKESGATVHYVDEIYDNGDIIRQEKLTILPGETAESLSARVLEIEHRLYPEVLQQLVSQIEV